MIENEKIGISRTWDQRGSRGRRLQIRVQTPEPIGHLVEQPTEGTNMTAD